MQKGVLLFIMLGCVPLQAAAICWTEASSRYGVPETLLKAVAKVESGFNPAVSNKNKNSTEDIGLMQINSTWLDRLASFGISRKDLLDPCTNLHVGAWILAQNFQSLGWSWDAIGAYNVGCKRLTKDECTARRSRYVRRVQGAMMKSATQTTPVSAISGKAGQFQSVVHVSERYAGGIYQ